MRIYDFLTESFEGTVYHGSGNDFNTFKQSEARTLNDYYGGGIAYFTDNKDVAKSYARTTAKRPGSQNNPTLYTVRLSIHNPFIVPKVYSGNELKKFIPKSIQDMDNFLRNCGLLTYGVDKYKIINDINAGKYEMSGDTIFKGLSIRQTNTIAARETLISLGFDGLQYDGGKITRGIHHNVWLPYYEKQITIINKENI